MKRVVFGALAFVAGVALVAGTAVSQPPEGKGGKDGKFGPKDGKDGKGGPPRFKMGTALPPFMVEQLNLTDAQKAQLAEIEKDLKVKLDKLLTEEQKKQLEAGPGGRPGDKGGEKGPPGKGGDKGFPGKGGEGGKGGERPPFEKKDKGGE